MAKQLWFLVVLAGMLMFQPLLMAQIEQEGRLELDHSWKDRMRTVISVEQEGLALIQRAQDRGGRSYDMNFQHLDKNLNEKWNGQFAMLRKFRLMGYAHWTSSVYLLFQETVSNRSVKIIRLDLAEQEVTEYDVKELVDLEIQEFEVIKSTAVIGGYYSDRPTVFAFDMTDKAVKTLQGVYQNESELLEIRVNRDSVTFNVLASVIDEKKDRTVEVTTYDYMGNSVRGYTVETSAEYQLLDGLSSSINDITQVIVGNYSFRNSSVPSGIYVNHINRRGEQTMTYHNYGELEHFYDFQGENKAEKTKAKARAGKVQGKESRFKTKALMRELEEDDQHIILQVEYYQPLTTPAIRGQDRFFANRLFFNQLRGFDQFDLNELDRFREDDYEFSHAAMVVLNKNGEVLWDDQIKLKRDLEGFLMELGRFQWTGEYGVYLHYEDEEIKAKILDGTGNREELVVEAKMAEGYELKYEEDNSIVITDWYDDYFVISGVQRVKGNSEGKKVFFLQKVRVGPSTE